MTRDQIIAHLSAVSALKSDLEAMLRAHPDTIKRYLPEVKVDGFKELAGSILFIEEYSDVEDWKVVYRAEGYRFAFKDDPKGVWYFRYLSANHGSHRTLSRNRVDHPHFGVPEWFYEWDDEETWHSRIIGQPREVAVSMLLWAWEGI